MLVKIHKSPNGTILAICDKELIGKKFTQGKLQLNLTSSFYKGEEILVQKILELLKRAYIVNLVGKKAISFGLKANVIDKKSVMKIKNIPICQGVIVRE